jgi:hypothetical protein
MRSSFFYGLIFACVIASIGYGVTTSDVTGGFFWPHFGLNLVWGELGLAVALVLTFPFLRRIDLVMKALAGGAFLIPLLGFLPAMGYQELQMFRDGARSIGAADLAHLPANPTLALMFGVWRYDLAATGTYVATRGEMINGKCEIREFHYCRVPIVGTDWQPGQPVLAIASCDERGSAATKQALVRLVPANAAELAITDLERGDVVGKKLFYGTCTRGPETTEPDFDKAPFHFDGDRGFLVLSVKSSPDEQRSIIIIECLFAAGALGFALRPSQWRTRVPTKREAQNDASGNPVC